MDDTAFLIEASGERTPIVDGVTIGREPGSGIRIDDPAVSRQHALVRRTQTGFQIEDLQSANGTYVNDELISAPTPLHSGDRITVGTNDLIVALPEAEADETARTVVAPIPDEIDLIEEHTHVAPFNLEGPDLPLGSDEPADVGALEPVGSVDDLTKVMDIAEAHTLSGLPVAGPAVVPAADAESTGSQQPAPASPPPTEIVPLQPPLSDAWPEPAPQAGALPREPESPSQAAIDSAVEAAGDSTTAPPSPAEAPNALQVVARLGRAVHEATDLGALLRAVAQQLVDGYRVGAAAFYLADEAGSHLQCVLAAGDRAFETLGVERRWGEGLAGRAAAEKKAGLYAGDADAGSAEAEPGSETLPALAAPIELPDGRVVGVLSLLEPLWEPAFTQTDIDFAVIVTQQVGLWWPSAASWVELSHLLEGEVRGAVVRNRFMTADPDLRRLVAQCAQAVGEGRSVYLWGEPGTGRMHLARTANQFAAGDEARFVAFDCSGTAAAEQEDALFRDGTGAWTRAETGMLFLQNAERLPTAVLQAIAQRQAAGAAPALAFSGAEEPATVAEGALLELVGDRCFHLPPLRSRLGDLPLLAGRLAQVGRERYGTGFTGFRDDAVRRLGEYTWPGNVDELAGVVLQIMMLGDEPSATAGGLARLAPDLFGARSRQTTESSRGDPVQVLAADALAENHSLQEGAAAEILRLSPEDRSAVIGAILRAVESSDDPRTRARGIEALGRTCDPRVTPYVAGFLADSGSWLQAAAVVALGQTAAPETAVTGLREVSQSEEPAIAMLALLALGRVGGPSALEAFPAALDKVGDWRPRAAVAAALSHLDPAGAGVGPLVARSLQQGDMLPSRTVRLAHSAGILTAADIRRIVENATLPSESKIRLLALVGQGDEPGIIELMSDLAYLALAEAVQQALAEHLARRGERGLPAIMSLIASSSRPARTVGLSALSQLAAPAAVASGLRQLASDPVLRRSLAEALDGRPEAFSSTVIDHLDADWRLEPLLQMLVLLAAAQGEELIAPSPE